MHNIHQQKEKKRYNRRIKRQQLNKTMTALGMRQDQATGVQRVQARRREALKRRRIIEAAPPKSHAARLTHNRLRRRQRRTRTHSRKDALAHRHTRGHSSAEDTTDWRRIFKAGAERAASQEDNHTGREPAAPDEIPEHLRDWAATTTVGGQAAC